MRRIGPCFAGEVDGIDLCAPLGPEEVAAIHAGMDEFAVRVFPEQAIDDAQQLAFSRSLGELEHAIGTSLRAPDEYRLPTTFADVSNLDQHHQVFARDDRRRLFAIGNRLWHSDSSFKAHDARQRDVGNVAAVPRDQPRVLAPPHPRSEQTLAHSLSSSRAVPRQPGVVALGDRPRSGSDRGEGFNGVTSRTNDHDVPRTGIAGTRCPLDSRSVPRAGNQ